MPTERAFTVPTERYSGEDGSDDIVEESDDLLSDVPPSLAPVVIPILRVASEVEGENPRVAYLCRFTAFETATQMDPRNSGRGVRQFVTKLVHRLEKDEVETRRCLASTDAKEIQQFLKMFCMKNLEDLQTTKPDERARYNQTASVLYDVLKCVTPERYHSEFHKYFKLFEKEKDPLHYNILPFNISGPTQPVMEIPEIKAAVEVLRRIENLPMPKPVDPTSTLPHDLFDWLGQTFGFQESNVENQKEHLILLLANIHMREEGNVNQGERYNPVLQSNTVIYLKNKLFQNYFSWCQYLHVMSNINNPKDDSTQQLELLYTGLYLLIWGEASNVRFMPECLCYIFHHMARDLNTIISSTREGVFHPPFRQEAGDALFLQRVIQPIYNVIQKEAATCKRGNVSHSNWRNYDDLNEYFWSKKCFKQLGWPIATASDFFVVTKKSRKEIERMSKTNFVVVRTFLHLFRSFDRMWTFFILAFQAMFIIAWTPSGSLSAIFEPVVFRNVLTIFITAAFLNFVQATLEIVLNWKAWRSLENSQKIRYILKFVVSTAWLIVLATTYSSSSMKNPKGIVMFFSNSIGHFLGESTYNFAVALYMLPNILSAFLFIFRPTLKSLGRSNTRVVRFLLWWNQPKLYVAGRMYEDTCSLLKYTSFWILLLMCKLTFSFYVEVRPLVGPARTITFSRRRTYSWQELIPYLQHTLGVVITLWAPVLMVYFMDTQIWYIIFSTIYGGLDGAFSRLGKIRTLRMLRLRFEALPRAFSRKLVPRHESRSKRHEHEEDRVLHLNQFSDVWNAFIISLQDEDLISNSERNLLIIPEVAGDTSVFQWPPFLLASMIPTGLDIAKSVRTDQELRQRMSQDPYTYYAVVECYETLSNILYSLTGEPSDKKVLDQIRNVIDDCIQRRSLVRELRLHQLPELSAKFDTLLALLSRDEYVEIDTLKTQVSNLLQDIMEIITQDIMKSGEGILRDENRNLQLFSYLNLDNIKTEAWKDKCIRLRLLLTMKESAVYVPTNLEARRRITFFANSFFMKMPNAPRVRSMMSFSVLTPYFKEEVLFSAEDLHKRNEDGISILFYLRKIYPDEWKNFLERIDFMPKDEDSLKLKMDEIRPWASYRAQTLTRAVRGMMYYRKALEIQCIQDGFANLDRGRSRTLSEVHDVAEAIADIKFTYVVSCELYGVQKISKNVKEKACYRNILNLMITYPSLRVAYIDEVEAPTGSGTTDKTYYSVLVKGAGDNYDEEIYRIKLPGNPKDIGEGRAENLNHAIIFTRGEALQSIDMNQDNYLEEAFKMRNMLEEFACEKYGKSKPTILSLREHIFTGSVSSLGWFVSNHEISFVTIGQRVLANLLKVPVNYGHPRIFDRLFHITRGGISKASKTINLTGDIFSGFNSTMREGHVAHQEYMQLGKGRDVGMNQISSFEANVANGNGEQTLSRDIYRLGRRFDFYRMLSFYFTTVGFYFSSTVTVLAVYVFLYGRLFVVMSGLEKSMLLDPRIQGSSKPLENALAMQAVFDLGFMLVLPVIMEIGLEKGFRTALGDFVIMQLQLVTMYFTFQLGTKTHYYGRTILHGSAKYRSTGRGFVVYHAKFAENYRMYSRSHFVKGLELLVLLIVYQAYGSSYSSTKLHIFVAFSMWFLLSSWLFAPFIFNPSCFERQKAVDDWTDWRKWMEHRGGIGISVDQSWEAWWISEQEHLRDTSIYGFLLEIIVSLRFLIYLYGIVYHLNIAHSSRSILVYAFSWLLMLTVLFFLKVLSIGQRKFGSLLFLCFVAVVSVQYFVCKLTVSGVFISIIGFVPTGWCILLVAQACSRFLANTMMWNSIMELARAYDNMMGFILYLPIGFLSLFSFISEFQTLLLFNQASSRGIQISRILAGQ